MTHSNIHIETLGNGQRKVVALHCSLGRAAGFKGLAACLAEEASIIAPDWPGHGKSAPWTEPTLMRNSAVAITADIINDQQVDLIGHSYGGIIALDYATRHPENVRTLTLIEPILLAIAGQDDRPLLDDYLAQMQPHFDALADGRNEDAARVFMDIWGGGVKWDKLPEPARAGLTQQIPVVDACKPGDEHSHEELRVLHNLHKLTMPIQLIYGDQTLPVVKQVMLGLKKRLPMASLNVIENAGHMVPLTHADQVANLIKSLFEETDQQVKSNLII